jgi:hypothetical protein
MTERRQRPCWEIGLLILFPWLLLFEGVPSDDSFEIIETDAEPGELLRERVSHAG